MKHFNLELERLEQRIVPTALSLGLGASLSAYVAADYDCGTSASEGDCYASSGGSCEASKGSKSGYSGTGSSN